MGFLKKLKKALGLETKRQIPKQKPKRTVERAPNVQKKKVEAAYRAKRQVKEKKAVSSMSRGQKQTFTKNTQKSPVQRFNAGAIRGGAFMGLPSNKGVPKSVRNSFSYKAGNFVGTGASYLTGYGGVGRSLAKGGIKLAAKSAPRAAKTGLTTKSFLTSAKKGDDLLKGAKIAVKVGEKQVEKKLPVNRYAVDKGARTIEKATRKDTTNALKRLSKEVSEAKGVKGNVAKKIASTKIVQKGAKQAVKASGAKEGTKAFERAVEREALKKGEKVVSDIGKKVKQNVIADATAGIALDTTHAVGDDIKIGSDEYRDYMAKSAAMNVGFGVGAEALGGIVKGVKTLKNGKKVVEIEKDGKITHRVLKGNDIAHSGRPSNRLGAEAVESEKVAQKTTEGPSLASEYRGTVMSQYDRAQKRVRKGNTVRAQAQAMDVARRESPDIYSERLPLPQIRSKGKGRTGYHAGDLGKAEYHHNQAGSGRHTGAFGTGTYFAGDKNIFKESGYKNRPHHEVKYDNYNLYRPKDKTQGLQVHDDLRTLNRESLNIKKLSKRMNTGDKELEKMRNVFDDSSAEYSPKNLSRVEEIADDVLSKGELESIRKDAKAAFKKSNKTMTKEEAERLATKDAEDMQAELADYELSMSQEEIDRYMSERIETYMNGDGKSEEEYYFNYLIDALDEQVHGDIYGASEFLDNIEKSKEIIPRLAKNLGKSEDEVRKAFDEMVDTVSKYGDVNPKNKLDSASTVLMKKLGYEGVDVTGIKGLDNTEYGSVIYDLKPEAPSGTPGLKRAKLQRPEEVSALKAATEDKGFVEKVRKGEINVQEYAKKNNVSMREATIDLHAQYSAIGKDAGDEVSKTASTLHDAPYMTKEQKEAMDSLMDEGMFNKKTQSHKEAFTNAKERIDKHGYDSVAETISAKVERGVVFNQDDTADARLCIEHFLATGETKKAEKLMEDVTIAMSETGRTLQSMRMFMANTPSGKVNLLKRQVKKLSERKGVDIKVDDKYYEAIKNAKTEKEIIEANKAFQKHVWDQVPANWVEKLNAWRYLAMLGNPKTHLRNVFGSVLYVPIRTLDDIISTGIEKATVKQADRTKAILNYASKSDKALLKAADDSWESGTGEMLRMTSGKYLENGTDNLFSLGSRPSDSRIFKTKPVDAASQKNANALDAEDLFFMKRAYKHYYAQFLKAKGITADSITEELAKEAEKYAGERSLKATYRDTNVLADFIRKGKRYASMKTSDIPTTREGREAIAEQRLKKVGGVALEALVPFAKTPANILARGIEHSPVGLVRGMADVVKAKNADEVIRGIERLSAGLTGTGLMGVGVYFGANGLADGSVDYTNKEDKFRQELGKQAYSIRVGDHTVTADWAAPMSMPFFIGVEIGKGRDAEDTLAALSKVQEPLFNLTMLQSLNNALDNQWGDATGITNTAKKIAQSYAGQFLPTVGGQIARTMQKDTSSTLATDENTTVREYNRWKNQLKNKVPGLADTNAPKLDSFGRKETKKTAEDYIKAGILNAVSPANVKEVKNDPVANELLKLKKEGADNSVIPNTKPSNYTVHIGDKDAPLSPKEYTRMQEIAGKESRKKLKELFNSEEYQKMDMASKEKAISGIYTDAKKKAKIDVLRRKGYSETDIAWDNYLTPQQKEKFKDQKGFKKELKKAGVSAKEFEDYRDQGATLQQLKAAKKKGIDTKTYIGAMSAKKGSKSYGETLARWIDGGYVKSFEDFQVYDADAKTNTWNAIVWAKNNGMSTKKIAKIIGTDDSKKETRNSIYKYGRESRGSYDIYTTDALTKWVEKNYKGKSRKEKALAWRYYGYGWSYYQDKNPYL